MTMWIRHALSVIESEYRVSEMNRNEHLINSKFFFTFAFAFLSNLNENKTKNNQLNCIHWNRVSLDIGIRRHRHCASLARINKQYKKKMNKWTNFSLLLSFVFVFNSLFIEFSPSFLPFFAIATHSCFKNSNFFYIGSTVIYDGFSNCVAIAIKSSSDLNFSLFLFFLKTFALC